VEVAGVSEDVYNWSYPDGWTRLNPPDIHSLNDLFKYAVPEALKTYKVAMFSEPKGYSVYFFRDSDACSKTAAFDPNPGRALAEAIEKVIVK